MKKNMHQDMPAVELLSLIEALDATKEEKTRLRDAVSRLVLEKTELVRAIRDLED